jgi:hypothetical protein
MPAMKDAPRQTFPVYVFTRRHAIETPDRILAGTLRLNIFRQRRLSHRQRLELAEIIHSLTDDARAGRLPLDGVVVGWPGDGRQPVNGVDTSDAEIMTPWIARAFTVAVRVGCSGDQTITLDGPRSRRPSSVC